MNLQKIPIKLMIEDAKNFMLAGLFGALYLFALDKICGGVCWLLLATGFPCPFCGMTRASFLFLKGDFIGAWQMHAMFYLVLLFVPFYIFFRYFVKNGWKFIKIYVIIFFVLTIGYYIYRMSNMFPVQEPLEFNPDNWINYLRKMFEVKGISNYFRGGKNG